jgi:hypothetical protein
LQRREKVFWLLIGLAMVVGVMSLIPAHYEICEVSEKTKEEHCASYQVVQFLGIKVPQILDRMGGVLTALATLAIAAFTLTLKRATDRLWDAGERQITVGKQSADAAAKAAQVAERALVAVERPIIQITMPEVVDFKGEPDPSRARYGILIENLGRQIATIYVANAHFIIQESSVPPPLSAMRPQDETFCPIFFIGELPIKPGGGRGLWCHRTAELTAEEITGLNDGSLFGFFNVAVVYDDPVGTQRSTIVSFSVRPPVGSGIFTQVLSGDTVLTKATTQEQKEAHRQYVGGLLEIQRDMDRRKHSSGLIHSDDSQIERSSSSSRDESRNCRERHPSGPPTT